MKLFAAGVLALALAGCATAEPPPACPAGQEPLRTAQLFFGRKGALNEAEFKRFIDQELTPRFSDGLTVLEGGGKWRGDENLLIREAAKVVLIVLPRSGDASSRLTAAREAYKTRFGQDSVLVITQPSCVTL